MNEIRYNGNAATDGRNGGCPMKIMKCPACGAPVQGQITSRMVVCEYCETQFVLDEDMASAVMEASEPDEYEEYYGQWDSMADFAAAACSDFLEDGAEDYFNVSNKIFYGLGIEDEEDVFLIHDDSMLGRGKNGFAITEAGLYCRDMGEPTSLFLDWASFAQYDQPYTEDTYVKVNDVKICYYTNDADFLPYLLALYDMLHAAAQYLAWDDGQD